MKRLVEGYLVAVISAQRRECGFLQLDESFLVHDTALGESHELRIRKGLWHTNSRIVI